MLGVIGKIIGGIAALVGVVAIMSSPQQAAKTAGSSMGTVGITVGALAGSIPDLVTGFNVARVKRPTGPGSTSNAGCRLAHQPGRTGRGSVRTPHGNARGSGP
jgi:Ca2+/Na+ antiporter